MRGVVVAQRALGVMLAPRKFRPSQQAAEETHIECVKDFLKVIEATFGAKVALAAAGCANEFSLAGNGGYALTSAHD